MRFCILGPDFTHVKYYPIQGNSWMYPDRMINQSALITQKLIYFS